MKTLFASLIALLILVGCTPDNNLGSQESPVIIKGNQCTTFSSEQSRASFSGYLPELSRISFFSSGGLHVDGSILTYSGHSWEGILPEQWDKEESSAHVLAYYPPVLSDSQPIYNEHGELQDILFCRQSIPHGHPVQLTFGHLFSRISFSVSPTLNQKLKQIEFTPSVSIAHITPETAQITYSNQLQYTTCFPKQEDGVYSLIIPSHSQMSIHIALVTEEQRIQTELTGRSFESGCSYQCQIKTTEGNIGIYTPEDFIAFTHLINGNEYNGRSLEEFGTTVDGVTTYYLQNDLTFTKTQCAELLEIGWIKTGGHERGFKDVFDGQNHTLHNVILSTFTYRLRTGLFGLISESGIVKNLQLSQTSYSSLGGKCAMAGLLCGENRGRIDGCRVVNSVIDTNKANTAGGIVGINKGLIINCSVKQTDFSFKDAYYGGIANINTKGILNCFTEKCVYKNASSGGGICYEQREGGYIENCFSHNNTYPSSYGALMVKGDGGRIDRCYYPHTQKSIGMGKITIQDIFSYHPTTYITEDRNLLLPDLLNQWIDREGKSEYPDCYFLHWKEENTLIIHVRP